MTTVSIVGDAATTTAVAVAASWPADRTRTVIELDPTGGALAGWLDAPLSPSISTLVTHSRREGLTRDVLEPLIHRSGSGIDVIVAPVRATESWRAVAEADPIVADAVRAGISFDVLLDHGALDPRHPLPTSLLAADAVVLVHRQPVTARAAAVRVDRLTETAERLAAATAAPLTLAVIGDDPFDPAEISTFVGDSAQRAIAVAPLPVDDLAAAVLAGRPGVSRRRLARMSLLRAGGQLAADVLATADPARDHANAGTSSGLR
ncbi:MAG: hypothetical protein AAGA42_06445 [Actinomycetota bacterium]